MSVNAYLDRLMAHFPNADNKFDTTTMEQCNTVQKLRPRPDGNPEQLIGELLPY